MRLRDLTASRPEAGERRAGSPSTRPDASMALLVDLMGSQALDPGYALAARRRDGSTDRPPGRPATALAVLAAGLVMGVAAGQLRADRPAELRARDALRRQAAAALASLDATRRAVSSAEAQLGGGGDGEALASVGLAAVRGPGVEVSVDDAAGGGARVLDRDLQRLVNALWAAGAEAVSVGGERLTAASAIRSAGEAVLVDYRPLRPPYTVLAVGDPGRLQSTLALSPAFRQLTTLSSAIGLRLAVRARGSLFLPAAPAPATRAATGTGR